MKPCEGSTTSTKKGKDELEESRKEKMKGREKKRIRKKKGNNERI